MSASSQAITDFWSWWAEYAGTAAELVRAGDVPALDAELTPRIHEIHPELVWETAAPVAAEFCLVVGASGDTRFRAIAERWLRQAPPPDETWEFRASRPARPEMLGMSLDLDGHELDLSHVALDVRFVARQARFDVSVYHPDFAFVDEETRQQVAFLALDWAIGEDEVVRWIGNTEIALERPTDAIPAPSLRPVIDDVASRYAEPIWLEMTGELPGEGGSLHVTARFPLRPVDFPAYDQHLAADLPYDDRDERGLPTAPALEALEALEQRLVAASGEDAVLIARQTAAGVRTLHFYADVEAGVGERFALALEDQKDASVRGTSDPGWETAAPFRT